MKEDLLHFVWQYQYFHKENLYTEDDQPIQILFQGHYNSDAGPDFLNCKIRVGDVEWVGNIEIHIKASDWNAHQHESDEAYNSVILHVVYTNDRVVCRRDGSIVPVLELKDRVFRSVVKKYEDILEAPGIPCLSMFNQVASSVKFSMLDAALSERLERKANRILSVLEKNGNDWEETCYQILASNFGFKLNNEPFLRLSKIVPFRLINKCSGDQFQIEALLFGMAGFLNTHFDDDYPNALKKEFDYLSVKFSLKSNQIMSSSEWKFLRVRPSGFPSIRIAQFAALLSNNQKLFYKFIESQTIAEVSSVFKGRLSTYWHSHYYFDDKKGVSKKQLGRSSINNLIINTVTPLLAAYSKQKGLDAPIEKAIQFLERLPAEDNSITKIWKKTELNLISAFDSQASIELYTNFCLKKQCLKCKIGINILKETCING